MYEESISFLPTTTRSSQLRGVISGLYHNPCLGMKFRPLVNAGNDFGAKRRIISGVYIFSNQNI